MPPRSPAAVKQVLRSAYAAELAAAHFYRGQSLVLHNRPDARAAADDEAKSAEHVKTLLKDHRVRPSPLQASLGGS
jgi:demethoxyubiquinone hydroxylase (CLK1/Coq7/Cat5 family)